MCFPFYAHVCVILLNTSNICTFKRNNELVFDAEYPEVFAAYCKKQDTLMAKFRKPWSVKLHHNLPSNFRIAVHTVLLSAERFARQPRVGGGGVLAGTVAGAAAVGGGGNGDVSDSDSGSGSDGGEGSGGDAGSIAVAAVAAVEDGAAATSLLLLPPEIWEKILGYLVRGDWTNDRHGATATSGSPPSGKSASKPSKKHKFKERNGKA